MHQDGDKSTVIPRGVGGRRTESLEIFDGHKLGGIWVTLGKWVLLEGVEEMSD